MTRTSALGPIDPAFAESGENERKAHWFKRELAGSLTGRIVMSGYESLRASGTNVVCLSPWGDSSPLFLPCVRFRDLAIESVMVATGGTAAIASPAMDPISDAVTGSFGGGIGVNIAVDTGYNVATTVADELVTQGAEDSVPAHSKRLETTAVKNIEITLPFKHTVSDAALGFYRGSTHADKSLFSSVKDYLSIEKGWYSPYLFASARRPVIPRTMQPDIVFCHGPFLEGDYRVGETLLKESASVISFCDAPPPHPQDLGEKADKIKVSDKLKGLFSHKKIDAGSSENSSADKEASQKVKEESKRSKQEAKTAKVAEKQTRTEDKLAPQASLPQSPRRMVIMLVGLKPHRKIWSTSARPQESVIRYILLNGCPSVVLPVKPGSPLVAWNTLTLKQLWQLNAPKENDTGVGAELKDVSAILFEYVDLCVDWDRARMEGVKGNSGIREGVKDAMTLLLAAALRSKDSRAVKKDVDEERAGIAMWRIP
ncbi:hypothetical protein CYLTODRAFT_487743 [Cylindrobasidium torrendii FP15055 ss-10]|uniref:Uncharacterized protein n=1 Tax=Cylindrobasidium torrendii FP15055 ss-10 TaxID=1314674 RepID=A0A0D7BK61_9AGAR|nr:hypothetical protein CYLTODRAFT_487743 [Cylindrobasidium torrendii FP15055 ss-10]